MCRGTTGSGWSRSGKAKDRTVETRTIPRTLQVIDLITKETGLMEMLCDMIAKNKSIGLYAKPTTCRPTRSWPSIQVLSELRNCRMYS